MVRQQVYSRAGLAAIDGVGPARVARYADAMLACLKALADAPAAPAAGPAP